MKNPISISNLRRPLRGVLFLIILLIASNLFISSISQFFIVNREIDNISRYYRSAGYLVPSYFPWDENLELDPNYTSEEIDEMFNVQKAQELITNDPMIAFENGIRQTTGLMDGLYKYRKDSRHKSYMSGENSFDLIFIGEIKEAYKSRSAENIYEGSLLNTEVIDILGGVPDYIESDIYYKNYQEHHIGFLSHSIEDGEKFEYINDDVIDELYKLEQGKKYLFRSFNMMTFKSGSISKPLYEGGPLYIELDDGGEIDWDNPEFKIIKDEIDFINQNIISYKLIGTEDMTGMPEVQDGSKDYYLIDGRWIDNRDNESKNHVVVINQVLAEMYELNIGDKLQIKMRDSERGTSLYTEKDKKEWRTYYTSEPISFEIVGLYESNVYTGFHETIYIPESTIPKELGRYTKGLDEPILDISYSLYNFVLKNPEDEAVFMEKYKEPISELGFELRFIENNINSFRESSAPMKRSSMISFILFTVLLILVQGFVVYIYVEGNKLNYAIERALGIPSKVSERHLIQPLIIFGAIASTIGGYIGYNTAVEKSTELLGGIPSSMERTVNAGLDIKHFILFVILSMIPLIAILFLRTRQLKNTSVIDLINNNSKKKNNVENLEMIKATTISTEQNYEEKEAIETMGNIEEEVKKEEKDIITKDSNRSLRRFSIKHTLRSKVTSILLIVLAGIFVFSLLWMNYLTIKNRDLIENAYEGHIITADIVLKENVITKEGTGVINKSHIDNLTKTGLLKDYKAIALMIYDELYRKRDDLVEKYEVGEKDKVHFYTYDPNFRVEASNKPYNSEQGTMNFSGLNFIDGYSLEDLDKEFTADYTNKVNPKIINEEGKEFFPILVSNKAMEHFDLELGDKILLKNNSNYLRLIMEAYGTIVGTFDKADSGKDRYGFATRDEEGLFIYPISVIEAVEYKLYYNKMEFSFNPEMNKEVMERKEELRRTISSNPANIIVMDLKFWDGELTNVVEPLEKNISLLEVLYPVTFILSIVIASILSFIMVLRRSLDVAILRILGVKGKEVRWNLFRENIILVLIGIVVACIIVIGISANAYPIALSKYSMVIGGYLLGTIVGLILGIGKVTNKKPLDMLQVKE